MSSTARMSAGERREQLLKAARSCFTAFGYRATTAQVAERAGVSEALVIKHFGTKNELFRAAIALPLVEIFEQRLRTLRERPPEQRRPMGTPRDHMAVLRARGHDLTDLVSRNRELILSLIRDAHEFPDIVSRLLELLHATVAELANTFATYAETEDYRDFDPTMTTYAGLGALTLAALVADRPHQFVDDYYDMTFHGLLSEEGRRDFEKPDERA